MINNTRKKQAFIIVAMLLLVGFLFSRDIKGLVVPKNDTQVANEAEVASPQLTLNEVSTTAKNLVSTATAKEITALENAFESAKGADKNAKAKLLAQKWDDLEQTVPSAMYLELVATSEPTLTNWLNSGNRFLKAYENTRDSLIQSVVLQKANASFKSAIAIDSTSLDSKTGLGVTIVNGMGAPMQGIKLLQEVVQKDPNNLKANLNLGAFAIRSGQFDKAITRFNFIVNNLEASPNAYLYLATAYEGLGKNSEAIEAYLNAKKLAANPSLSKWIDEQVSKLKNKVN
jgi:tetratricopeptide (TPR) repeat protein